MTNYQFTKIRQQFERPVLTAIEQTVAEQVGAKLQIVPGARIGTNEHVDWGR